MMTVKVKYKNINIMHMVVNIIKAVLLIMIDSLVFYDYATKPFSAILCAAVILWTIISTFLIAVLVFDTACVLNFWLDYRHARKYGIKRDAEFRVWVGPQIKFHFWENRESRKPAFKRGYRLDVLYETSLYDNKFEDVCHYVSFRTLAISDMNILKRFNFVDGGIYDLEGVTVYDAHVTRWKKGRIRFRKFLYNIDNSKLSRMWCYRKRKFIEDLDYSSTYNHYIGRNLDDDVVFFVDELKFNGE